MKRAIILLPVLPAVLFAAGFGLIGFSAATPPYTDPDAYEAAIDPLPIGSDFQAASEAFFAASHRFSTSKWQYADAGYAVLAWAAIAVSLMTLAKARGWRALLRSSRSWGLSLLLCIFGVGALLVGTLAAVIQQLERHRLPPWADSIGIPIHAACAVAPWVLGASLIFALTPLLFRAGNSQNLFAVSSSPHLASAVVTLVYAGPLAFCALLVLDSVTTGGWATGPGGLALGWAFLNARANAIGTLGQFARPRQSAYPPQIP